MTGPILAPDIGEPTPPANLEAEQCLLGAILLDNRSYAKARDLVRADQFSYLPHGRIYQACADIIEAGGVANSITLKEKFSGGLEEVGGAQYLARMASAVPSAYGAGSYAQVVHDLATRRQLWHLCRTYTTAACDGTLDVTADELTAHLMSEVQSLCKETGVTKIRTRREVLNSIIEGMKAPPPCYATGLAQLDKLMGGGLFAKKAYGIAARKKFGKTALMGTISHNLNCAGIKHLYVCAEMSPEEVEHRNLARDMGINSIRFLRPDEPHFVADVANGARISPDNTLYLEAPGIMFAELKRILSLAVAQHGIKGFFVDYLQLIGGKESRQTTAEFLDTTAQWIANFARQANVFGVVASQVNQEGNVRGGEGLLNAFDMALRLCRAGEKEEEPEPEAWLEMMISRYTTWDTVGTAAQPALRLNPKGPFFEEI